MNSQLDYAFKIIRYKITYCPIQINDYFPTVHIFKMKLTSRRNHCKKHLKFQNCTCVLLRIWNYLYSGVTKEGIPDVGF